MPKNKTLIFIKSVFICPKEKRCRLYGARCLECFLEIHRKAFNNVNANLEDEERFIDKLDEGPLDDEVLVKETLDSNVEEPWTVAAFHLPVVQG